MAAPAQEASSQTARGSAALPAGSDGTRPTGRMLVPADSAGRAAPRTFVRRIVLDVPLYTAPLAVMLLGLAWQTDGTAISFAPYGVVILVALCGVIIVIGRLLPEDAMRVTGPYPPLWLGVMYLALGSIAILLPPMILSDLNGGYAWNTPSVILTLYTAMSIFIARLIFPIRMSHGILFTLSSIYSYMLFNFAYRFSINNIMQLMFVQSICIQQMFVVISMYRFNAKLNPISIAYLIITLISFTLFGITTYFASAPFTSYDFYTFYALYTLPFLYAASVWRRRQCLAPPAAGETRAGAAPRYAILPGFLVCAALLASLHLWDTAVPVGRTGLPLTRIDAAIWPILLAYIFLFASPLPRLLIEADLRGAPVPGASYADFRRLSRLGVSDELAARGPLAILAAVLAGIGRGLRAAPAALAPWLVLPAISAVLLPPWASLLNGASPAPLALPIAVWAAARWGKRALPPLACALVPHVIAVSLPMVPGLALADGRTLHPTLDGMPGFVAATLFWARFTADAELRRRLLTRERFGTGALVVLALLAGCVAWGSYLFADGTRAVLILNLLWVAASLLLVWGLSRAPIGGAMLVLAMLVGLRFALYDLGLWPSTLWTPLQFGSDVNVLIVEAPLFGLSPQRAAGLALVMLIARFALRAGMSERARRNTRFASPVAQIAVAALCIMLGAASLDLGPGRGIAGSTLDVPAGPQEPFLLILGFIIGLWLPRALVRLPRILLMGWAPFGVLAGVGIAMMTTREGTAAASASLIGDLTATVTLASLASFLAAIAFGRLVRLRAGDGAWESEGDAQAQAPVAARPLRSSTDLLYAGPSAVLDDLLGRDRRVPLARIIDATFAVPEARRLEEPGVTARMLIAAAPKPFAEVFETPAHDTAPARLVLGAVGLTLLVLNVAIAVGAVTTGARLTADTASQSTAPAAEDTPQQVQPQQQQVLPGGGDKGPATAR